MCKDNLRVILYAPKPVDTVQHCLKQNVSSQNEIYMCIFALQIWKTKSIWQSNYKYCNKDHATFCEKTCSECKKFSTIKGSLVICAK